MPNDKAITELLREWRSGNQDALEQLTPAVYDELRKVARRYMRSEHKGHTLQATALVHEAYTRLVDVDVPWRDRAHFFALAARMMRRILVNHAQASKAVKRGSGLRAVTLNEHKLAGADAAGQLLELNDALSRLADLDERKSRLVELHYFGGLTYEEMAEAMSISEATVHRELRLARSWLYQSLKPE